jgi:hypothetical protein
MNQPRTVYEKNFCPVVLPVRVTATAGLQALWWLEAAITLIAKSGKISRMSQNK